MPPRPYDPSLDEPKIPAALSMILDSFGTRATPSLDIARTAVRREQQVELRQGDRGVPLLD
jgi:hypothetical protein